jgi:hypothetical protein
MRPLVVLVSVFTANVIAAPASAGDQAGDDAISGPASVRRRGNLLVQFDYLADGNLTTRVIDASGTRAVAADLAPTYAVGAQLNHAATPHFSVGLAPRFVVAVNSNEVQVGAPTDRELDLRLRGLLHTRLGESPVEVFAFVEPGYSYIFLGKPVPRRRDPNGPTLALGLGVTLDLSERLFLAAEIGYQFGFQSTSANGVKFATETDYAHVGLGAGTRF